MNVMNRVKPQGEVSTANDQHDRVRLVRRRRKRRIVAATMIIGGQRMCKDRATFAAYQRLRRADDGGAA